MLDWLSAPTGAAPEKAAHFGSDQSLDDEAPETPAHIFAVRAFKTALFGTPAPPETVRAPKLAQPSIAAEHQNEETGDTQKADEKEDEKPLEQIRLPATRRPDPFASPSKGILLTPGTAATKRKSVSFKALATSQQTVSDARDEDADVPAESKSKDKGELSRQREDLRRRLFQDKAGSSTAEPTAIERRTQKTQATSDAPTADDTSRQEAASNLDNTAEVTIDLKSPRSKSGQHWKREYQRDHDKSKLEMRKLIRYGQAAKSYAVKRDQEAIRLGDKLKDTESQVKEMESKVSELAVQLSDAKLHDDNQARILDDLASQTAQALRYKQKAERYRLALRESQPVPSLAGLQDDTLPLTAQEFQSHIAPDAEISELKKTTQQAERRVAELEKKNATLKQNIFKAKEDLKIHEDRTQKSTERRKRREDKLVADKKDLKDRLAKSEEQVQLLRQKLEDRSVPEDCQEHPVVAHATHDQEIVSSRQRVSSYRSKSSARDLLAPQAPQMVDEMKENQPRPKDRLLSKKVDVPRQKHNTGEKHSGLREREAMIHNRDFSDQSIEIPRGQAQPKDSSDIWMQMEDSSDQQTLPPAPTHRPYTSSSSRNTRGVPQNDPLALTPIPQARSHRNVLSSSILSGPATVRRPLPADRIAAAKKRLQLRRAEKMKDLGGKENMKLMT